VGHSTKESAVDLREQLRRLEAPVLGFIANGVRVRRADKYGYGYYGGPGAVEPDLGSQQAAAPASNGTPENVKQ